jgi:hypothetical protein
VIRVSVDQSRRSASAAPKRGISNSAAGSQPLSRAATATGRLGARRPLIADRAPSRKSRRAAEQCAGTTDTCRTGLTPGADSAEHASRHAVLQAPPDNGRRQLNTRAAATRKRDFRKSLGTGPRFGNRPKLLARHRIDDPRGSGFETSGVDDCSNLPRRLSKGRYGDRPSPEGILDGRGKVAFFAVFAARTRHQPRHISPSSAKRRRAALTAAAIAPRENLLSA